MVFITDEELKLVEHQSSMDEILVGSLNEEIRNGFLVSEKERLYGM